MGDSPNQTSRITEPGKDLIPLAFLILNLRNNEFKMLEVEHDGNNAEHDSTEELARSSLPAIKT